MAPARGVSSPVLVTGGTGALGAELVGRLSADGCDIVVWSRRAREADGNVSFAAVDVRDAEAVHRGVDATRPELIFHLAGTREGSPADLMETNVGGFANLAGATQKLGLDPLVVVAGSSAQYGLRASLEPLSESEPLLPQTPYGVTKAAQEELALDAWRAGGLTVIPVRLFNLIGPGQPRGLLAADVAAQLNDRACTELATGSLAGTRDFVDYRDAAAALVAIADRGYAGSVFNVCSGRPTPVRELVLALLRISGRELELVERPPARAGSERMHQVGDSSALTHATGWSAATSLEESLKDLLATR